MSFLAARSRSSPGFQEHKSSHQHALHPCNLDNACITQLQSAHVCRLPFSCATQATSSDSQPLTLHMMPCRFPSPDCIGLNGKHSQCADAAQHSHGLEVDGISRIGPQGSSRSITATPACKTSMRRKHTFPAVSTVDLTVSLLQAATDSGTKRI